LAINLMTKQNVAMKKINLLWKWKNRIFWRI
jgi:hypothetical protein